MNSTNIGMQSQASLKGWRYISPMCAVFDLNENVHASEAAYSLSREIHFASGFTKNACKLHDSKLAICYIMLLSCVLCLCGKKSCMDCMDMCGKCYVCANVEVYDNYILRPPSTFVRTIHHRRFISITWYFDFVQRIFSPRVFMAWTLDVHSALCLLDLLDSFWCSGFWGVIATYSDRVCSVICCL